MRIRQTVYTAVLFGLASVSSAASADTPVQATFDGSRLKPYLNAWRYIVTTPDGVVHPQGIWTDQLLRSTRDGKDVFVRTQGTVMINGKTSVVMNTFDPATMLPITDQQTLRDGGLQKRTFKASEVEAHRSNSPGGSDVVTTSAISSPIYDYYGGMYALLLSTAPLKLGYHATFSSIDEFTDQPVSVDFKVIGRERAPAGARGSIETWKIASSRAGQYDLVAWVSDQEPYVIRLNIILPDKRLFDWTII